MDSIYKFGNVMIIVITCTFFVFNNVAISADYKDCRWIPGQPTKCIIGSESGYVKVDIKSSTMQRKEQTIRKIFKARNKECKFISINAEERYLLWNDPKDYNKGNVIWISTWWRCNDGKKKGYRGNSEYRINCDTRTYQHYSGYWDKDNKHYDHIGLLQQGGMANTIYKGGPEYDIHRDLYIVIDELESGLASELYDGFCSMDRPSNGH